MHFVLAAGRRAGGRAAGGTSAHPSIRLRASERRSARLCPMIALFAFEGLSSPSDSDGGGAAAAIIPSALPLARRSNFFSTAYSVLPLCAAGLIHLQPREGTFPSILISYDAPSFKVKNDWESRIGRETDHNTRISFTELLPSFT